MQEDESIKVIRKRIDFLKRRSLGVNANEHDKSELWALQVLLSRVDNTEKANALLTKQVRDLREKGRRE